ncbi:MAG: hypothetical protein U0R24_00255 [Solirubrobacterales bacterium]
MTIPASTGSARTSPASRRPSARRRVGRRTRPDVLGRRIWIAPSSARYAGLEPGVFYGADDVRCEQGSQAIQFDFAD